jgi:hypothetical protein
MPIIMRKNGIYAKIGTYYSVKMTVWYVFMRQLVLVILCWWLSGMTVHSSSQNNKYQVLHKYSSFSWWWAHSRPKHVEKRNKRTKKTVHQNGFIYKIIQGYTVSKTKFVECHSSPNKPFGTAVYHLLGSIGLWQELRTWFADLNCFG